MLIDCWFDRCFRRERVGGQVLAVHDGVFGLLSVCRVLIANVCFRSRLPPRGKTENQTWITVITVETNEPELICNEKTLTLEQDS